MWPRYSLRFTICIFTGEPNDDYEGYDYDYDEYSYDEEINMCDETKTIYDMNNGNTCSNDEFLKLPPIDKIEEHSNYKRCCQSHKYLYRDECTVCLKPIIFK